MHTTAAQMKWRTTKAVRTRETEILRKSQGNPEFSAASSPWDICHIPTDKKITEQPHTKMKFRAIKQAKLEKPVPGKES